MNIEDRCIYCNSIIPEGRMICPSCEAKIIKAGSILQSNHATKEEIKEAFDELIGNIKEMTERKNDG